ncbi:hypothetical protein A6J80_09725 [Paracoccus yeei]|uniref:Uncharacterized protein n=1 Tax=Paracoccus yeei TaxID=147645 RepID=A0A1V0GRZ0_9RHOB|nr:hypothetical protein [Paracoccus yeei]ARC36626.1 hypothetical protein A6J80_09725 [Paracoccus yeei]
MIRHELRRPVISALIFVAATLLILAFGMAALGALLAPQVGWAGLWGAVTDFAASTAAQARAEGWAALSERMG